MILQAEEVERGFFMAPQLVLALSKKEPFTPDGIYVLNRYLESK